jgi:hypothetical protein
MSVYLQALLPPEMRRRVRRDVSLGAAQDLFAAALIDQAAKNGDPLARRFTAEAEAHLTNAAAARAASARLQDGAAQAAAMGLDRLAGFGADAALEQALEAQIVEQSVVDAVRESYTPGVSIMGYTSPAESALLQQKEQLSAMTIGERERAFSSLLADLEASSGNYGDADVEAEEKGDASAAERLAAAVTVFGADLPAVLGADAWPRMKSAFGVTLEKLKSRLARKKEKLKKIEAKIADLEAQGKSGPYVRLLQFRMKKLEESIEKVEGKIAQTEGAKTDAKAAAPGAPSAVPSDLDAEIEALLREDEDEDEDELGRMAFRARRRMAPSRRRRGPPPGMRPQLPTDTYDAMQQQYQQPYPQPAYEDEGYEEEGYEDEEYGATRSSRLRRQAFIGFFQRRADALGATEEDHESASRLLASAGKGLQAAGRGLEARGEVRKEHAPEVEAARKGLTSALVQRAKESRAAAKAARKGVQPAGDEDESVELQPSAPTARVVQGSGGWTYEQRADGAVKIVGAPSGHEGAVGKLLTTGPQYEAIVSEIGEFEATVGQEPRTYGERVDSLMRSIDDLIAEGVDPESQEVSQLQDLLDTAQAEAEQYGPDEPFFGDDLGGRDPGDDDDIDELLAEDDDLLGDDDDDAVGGRDPGDEDDLDELLADDAVGGRDPGDEDDLDELLEEALAGADADLQAAG